MAKYFLTNKAVNDLSVIWEYTFETWSENQADKYYHFLIDCWQSIAARPSIGKHYPEIADDIWGYRANRHIIFYRATTKQSIEIIRVLHGGMDLKSRPGE
jgi:toxin ParE1/3/4